MGKSRTEGIWQKRGIENKRFKNQKMLKPQNEMCETEWKFWVEKLRKVEKFFPFLVNNRIKYVGELILL